jgi:hypothetical protein
MKTVIKVALGLFILSMSMGPAAGPSRAEEATAGILIPSVPRLSPDFGRMPLIFISNRGQIDRHVDYYATGKDQDVFFTSEGITIALNRVKPEKEKELGRQRRGEGRGEAVKLLAGRGREESRWSVKLDFIGANSGVHPAGEAKTDTVISYFKGRPQDWRTRIAAYSRIIYRDLWPGIDLIYSGTADRLKYEFMVHPGADPSRIRLAYRGVTGVEVNARGQLQVETPLGSFRDETPIAYQIKGDEKADVAVSFRVEETAETGAADVSYKEEAMDTSVSGSKLGFQAGMGLMIMGKIAFAGVNLGYISASDTV